MLHERALSLSPSTEITTRLRYTLVTHPEPLQASAQLMNGDVEQTGLSVAKFIISISCEPHFVGKTASKKETHVVKKVTFYIPQRAKYTDDGQIVSGDVLAQNTAFDPVRKIRAEKSIEENWSQTMAELHTHPVVNEHFLLDPRDNDTKAEMTAQPFVVTQAEHNALLLKPYNSLSFVISDIVLTTDVGATYIYVVEELETVDGTPAAPRTLYIRVPLLPASHAITDFKPFHSFVIADEHGQADVKLMWKYHGLTSNDEMHGEMSYYRLDEETGGAQLQVKKLSNRELTHEFCILTDLNCSTPITLQIAKKNQAIDETSAKLRTAVQIQTSKAIESEIKTNHLETKTLYFTDHATGKNLSLNDLRTDDLTSVKAQTQHIETKTLHFSERATGESLTLKELAAWNLSVDAITIGDGGRGVHGSHCFGKSILLNEFGGQGTALGDGFLVASIWVKNMPLRGSNQNFPREGMIVGYQQAFLKIGLADQRGVEPSVFYQPSACKFNMISDTAYEGFGSPFGTVTLPIRGGTVIYYGPVGFEKDIHTLSRYYQWQFEYFPIGHGGFSPF